MVWIASAAASGRIGRNSSAGIRIPETLASDAAWSAGHVRARALSVTGGVLTIIGGIACLFPLGSTGLGCVVLAVVVAVLIVMMMAARVARVAARAADTERPS